MDNKNEDVNNIASLLEQTKVEHENKVSFKGCALKLNSEEDAEKVVESIRLCKDLQVLELVGNTIGLDAAKVIADALKSKPELERCLWADMFTGRLRSEIPNSLRFLGNGIMESKAHLVELDLSDNAFGADCVKACVDLLKSSSSYSLQILKFNNNGLGGGGVILAETLIECHKKSSGAGKPLALKTFIAGRNRLENPGAKALAKAFTVIGTLENIQLPQNGIRHEGIAALAEAVKFNKSLRHINLNDNTFTEKGAIPMAEGIGSIDSLQIINFGDCLVRTEGAKAIAKALKISNPNLKELILSFGEIQLEGGLKICESVSTKEALEKLDLNGNQFGEDGVDELKDIAQEFHCSDALMSLSDDEGCSSESEGDSDKSLDDSDRHISEIDKDSTKNINGLIANGDSSHDFSLSADNFFANVTSSNIVQLTAEERSRLMEEVAETVTDAEATAKALRKISELLTDDCLENMVSVSNTIAENLRNAVFQCVDVLMSDALEKYPNTPMIVLNSVLVEMGLLKSEDKKHQPVQDVRGLAVIVGHVCRQPYFPKFVKSVVRSVVAKENKAWLQTSSLRSQLLQLLYS